MQTIRAVSDNFQPTTTLRPVNTKCCHDDVPTRFYRVLHSFNIARPVFGKREKVKHRAVMPDIIKTVWQLDLGDVSYQPGNFRGESPKPLLCNLKRSRRYIQNRDILISVGKQIIYQRRGATT